MMIEVSSPPEYAKTTFLGLGAVVFTIPLSCWVRAPARAETETVRSIGLAKQGVQDRLLHVHAVFRLVQHHRLRSVQHLRCNLMAAMRGQAMHERRAAFEQRHQLAIHLVGLEDFAADLFF